MPDIPRKDMALGLKKEKIAPRTHMARYNKDLAQRVISRIAEGRTYAEVMKDPDVPSRQTFDRWLALDEALLKAFEHARKLSALSLEDEALDAARELMGPNDFDGTKVRAYQVAMDQLRWSASRRDPSRFGQQAEKNILVPIQINTTLDLGTGGADTPRPPDVGADDTFRVELPLGDSPPEIDLSALAPEAGDSDEERSSAPAPIDPALQVPDDIVIKKSKGGRGYHRNPKHKSPADAKRTAARKTNAMARQAARKKAAAAASANGDDT